MTKTDRREFIKRGTFAAAALTVVGAGLRPAMAQKDEDEDYWVADLGKIKDLNEKNPILVKAQFKDAEGTVVAEEKVFVRWDSVNQNAGHWVVLSAICQHLKCKVDFAAEEHKFICPCHGSQYDIDGKVIKRPSRKDLPDYSDLVDEEDGRLKLKRLPD